MAGVDVARSFEIARPRFIAPRAYLASHPPSGLARPAGTRRPGRKRLALKVGQRHDAWDIAERDGPQVPERRFRYDDPYKDTSYIAVRRIRSPLPFPFVTTKPVPHGARGSVEGYRE